MTLALVDEAVSSGARVHAACKQLEVAPRTLERWRKLGPDGGQDRRRGPHTTPKNALSAEALMPDAFAAGRLRCTLVHAQRHALQARATWVVVRVDRLVPGQLLWRCRASDDWLSSGGFAECARGGASAPEAAHQPHLRAAGARSGSSRG
jgi:transposase-like protein